MKVRIRPTTRPTRPSIRVAARMKRRCRVGGEPSILSPSFETMKVMSSGGPVAYLAGSQTLIVGDGAGAIFLEVLRAFDHLRDWRASAIITVLVPVNVPPSSAVTVPRSFAGSKGAFGPGERNPLQMTTYCQRSFSRSNHEPHEAAAVGCWRFCWQIAGAQVERKKRERFRA